MADITQIIKNFQTAVYGKEVRGSMVDLAEKVNAESSTALATANKADKTSNDAKSSAAQSLTKLQQLKTLVEQTIAQLEIDAANGAFDGPPGESGISAPSSGFFALSMESNGDLYVIYPDSSRDIQFEYDSATGNLYVMLVLEG